MSVGSSSGRTPVPRIGEDGMGNPSVGVFTTSDGGVSLSGHIEHEDGTAVRDPEDSKKIFRFQLGIEDWTVAMALGADLIEAAMKSRARMLRDIQYEEQDEARSALLTPPDPDDLP